MMRLRNFLIYLTFAFALQQLSSLAAADDDHGRIGKGAETLPLFDAHMHYKREAWGPFPPDVVLSLMDANGVAMALVSSTPDEGTIKLWKYAPGRFVPEMRPYTGSIGSSNWTKWNEVGDYIEQRISEYPHQGIGEFHLHRIDPQDEPLMKRIVSLALERNIPLHVHSDHEPIEYLYSLSPELTIIWAHAGMMEPPDVVADLMARYPGLYADTSYRETDILNGAGGIDTEWQRVLEKYADRFMVGSDTWVNDQWEEYDQLIAMNRKWLAYLTPRTASKIAFQNAERLFGKTIDAKKAGTR